MAETKITVRNNGPLVVEGVIDLRDQDGNPFNVGERTRIPLCRCGHSENKPICDGSHGRMGFKSEVKARELPPPVPKPA